MPLHGFTAPRDQVRLDPREVKVRGAVGVIRALQSVRTQEIRIDGASEAVEQGIGPTVKNYYGTDGNMGNALGENFDAGK